MAVSTSSSATIRGVYYSQGSSFVCYSSESGNGGSEGNGSSSIKLTKGETYYFHSKASGDYVSYPYLITDGNNTLGWYKESIFPYATHTVSYNANGGSGAPNSQTKVWGTALTLSSTIPTRTGYVFVGWSASSTSTSATYSAGGTYTSDSNITLYAIWKRVLTLSYNSGGGSGAPNPQTVTIYNATTSYKFTIPNTKPTMTGYTFLGWGKKISSTTPDYLSGDTITISSNTILYAVYKENVLTINYYSNYADYCTLKGESVSVSSNTNVKVHTSTHSYSATQPNGLADIQNESNLYMTRTGYTTTNTWGTSTNGGTIVGEKTGFDTGQLMAEALGKSLKNGDASVNIYAQWTENKLTVNYYSNYATEAFADTLNPVGIGQNVIVRTAYFYYDNEYTNGHWDYSYPIAGTYLGRIGYDATGYWGTTVNGGTLVSESDSYATGQELAEAIGKTLKTGDATINLYAQWKPNGIVYIDNGTKLEKYLVYIDNGTSWDIYLPYIDNGMSWDRLSG